MKKFLLALILLLTCSDCVFSAVINFKQVNGNASDTYIAASQPTNNFSTAPQTTYMQTTSGYIAVIDLTELNGQPVLSAFFNMYEPSRGGGHTLTLYRLLTDVIATEATFNRSKIGNNWNTPGALGLDTDYTTNDSVTLNNANGGTLLFDIKNMVNAAIANGATTLSFIIRNSSGNAYDTLNTFEATSNSPYLVVATGAPGQVHTFYVRPDGGTCGLNLQCTGMTNASYASTSGYAGGTGINQDCACNHPNWLTGTDAGIASGVMGGGDIAYISNASTYTIGRKIGNCTSDTCVMNVIPAGASPTQMTKIYGGDYNPSTGKGTTPAVLIGANNGNTLNIGSFTEIHYVDLKSRSGCRGNEGPVFSGPIDNEPTQDPVQCREETNGYGRVGLNIATQAGGIIIDHMTITGMSEISVQGYQLGSVETHYLHLYGGGSVGWSGDPSNGSCDGGNHFAICDYSDGPFIADHFQIKYAGCGMRAKDTPGGFAAGTAHTCLGQNQGAFAYGDGFGMNGKSGNWTITDCEIENNMSDGIDMLYDHAGKKVVQRCLFQGNIGAAFKSSSRDTTIDDSIIIDNCYHWATDPAMGGIPNAPGRSGTNCNHDGKCNSDENSTNCSDCYGLGLTGWGLLICRADATLSLAGGGGGVASNMSVTNSTIISNHSLAIGLGGSDCTNDNFTFKNNIFYSGAANYQGVDLSRSSVWLYVYSTSNGNLTCPGWNASVNLHQDNNILYNGYNTYVSGSHDRIINPQFVGPLHMTLADTWNQDNGSTSRSQYYKSFALQSTSPARAVNAGVYAADGTVNPVGNTNDAYNFSRWPAQDTGGNQFGSVDSTIPNGGVCYFDGDCFSDHCCNGFCSERACEPAPTSNQSKSIIKGSFGR